MAVMRSLSAIIHLLIQIEKESKLFLERIII